MGYKTQVYTSGRKSVKVENTQSNPTYHAGLAAGEKRAEDLLRKTLMVNRRSLRRKDEKYTPQSPLLDMPIIHFLTIFHPKLEKCIYDKTTKGGRSRGEGKYSKKIKY